MNTCTKHEIYDPKTNTCLKLNLKNKCVLRCVQKFLRYRIDFLDSFTENDRLKFLKFMNEHVFADEPFAYRQVERIENTQDKEYEDESAQTDRQRKSTKKKKDNSKEYDNKKKTTDHGKNEVNV